jgi:hypothetical protein
MIVDELIKSLRSILFKKFVASLDMTSVIESSTLCQSIKNDEFVQHNHRHENRIVEDNRHVEHDDDIVDLERHIADHSDLERHIADLSDLEKHIADHSDLEEHIADHSDHEERSSTEKHLRKHNERRIEAHREHSVINERRIETRERQSIIEEHRIDEHSDDHK